MRASLFPTELLSSSVQLFSCSCPLSARELAKLEAAGFKLPPELDRAIAIRKDEFAAGRYCAWRALGKSAIPQAKDRAPIWPAGFVGSIAHSDGVAAAAVARVADRASIGLDVEPCMTDERATTVRARLLTAGDEEALADLAGWSPGEKVTLVFSAKEAIYKCLHPICGQFFGFHDARLKALDAARGRFGFELLKALPGGSGGGFGVGWSGTGRFAKQGGRIFAAIELPAWAAARSG
jgi:enterobactin synthetase component D